MSDHRIVFGRAQDLPLHKEKFPPDDYILANQNLQSDPFHIYFLNNAHKEMIKHAKSSLERETGGILVGLPFESFDSDDQRFVIILAAIPQETDNRSITHFTIGPEESQKTRELMENKYHGLIAVGWYHTHPGHGIFLSEDDEVITKNIYNLDWHIACVIDPINEEEGYFIGSEGNKINTANEIGKSIILVKNTPLTYVSATKYYNRYRDALAADDKETTAKMRRNLYKKINESPELTHWKSQERYRDIEFGEHQSQIQRQDDVYERRVPLPFASSSKLNLRNIRAIYIIFLLFAILVFSGVVIFAYMNLMDSILLLGISSVVSLIANIFSFGQIFLPLSDMDKRDPDKIFFLYALMSILSIFWVVLWFVYRGQFAQLF